METRTDSAAGTPQASVGATAGASGGEDLGAPAGGASRRVRHSRSLFLYVLRGLAVNSLVGFLVLEAIMGIIFTVRVTEDFSFDLLIIFPVLLRAAGQAMNHTLPVSLLFGAALVIGRLNADREILAMRGFGLSPLQLLYPVLALSAPLLLLALYSTQYWVPRLRFANRNIETLIIDQLGYLGEGWNLEFSAGPRSLWIYHYNGPFLEGIFLSVSDAKEGGLPAELSEQVEAASYPFYIFAERGVVARGTGELEGRLVVDLHGVSWFLDSDLFNKRIDSNFMQRPRIERWRWTPRFSKKSPSYKDLTRDELEQEIAARQASLQEAASRDDPARIQALKRECSSLEAESRRRLALSLAVLTFPLAAFVIGLSLSSSNRLLPFFLSSTIIPAIFFVLDLVGSQLSRKVGGLAGLEYMGNFVLLAMAAALLWKIHRR